MARLPATISGEAVLREIHRVEELLEQQLPGRYGLQP